MLYIILDPGKSTGMTVIKDDKYIFGCTIDNYNWEWLMEKIESLCLKEKNVTILTEEFRVYPGMGNQQALQPSWSAEINGMLQYFIFLNCRKGKKYVLIKQWASTAKNYSSDAKLKQFGLWKGTKHQKDSARHYVYYKESQKNKQNFLSQKRKTI